MELLTRILQDLSIMVLTILVLVGGGYLVLLLLDWGLKWKSGRGESEGLAELWQATVLRKADAEEAEDHRNGEKPR